MYYSFSLLDGQIEILLRALELYSFNLHHTWTVEIDSDNADIRKVLVFHTYHEILGKYRGDYAIGYNLLDRKQEKLKGHRFKHHFKRK